MKFITIGSAKTPLEDFVVSRNAILGITKSGKTFAAKGVAEQLMEAGIPIIVFDAIGVWRYLKTPGAGRGYKVIVAGGESPDLPLTVHSAGAIVRAAIAGNIPLIIDLYDPKLSKADWRRIVQECFRILLYENKGMRHIFLEEAAEYAPQKVMDGQTYAEVEKLARMGGNRSLGITFINQRAQELNKAVLELCDNITLLRQRGTHAIDSLEKQMDKLSPTTAKEIALSLPNMTQGDCWVFTENMEEPIRTRSAIINSYHPDRRNPDHKAVGKSVDVESFVSEMSEKLETIIAEAKLNDPSEMRRRIKELEKQILQKPVAELKEVPVLTANDKNLIERAEKSCTTIIEAMAKNNDRLIDSINDMRNFLTPIKLKIQKETHAVRLASVIRKSVTGVPATRTPGTTEGSGHLSKCERGILISLAQYPQGRTASQSAILSGYSSGSGGFNNALSSLRSQNYITREIPMRITESGLKALGHYDPLPTGSDLIAYWLSNGKLSKCEKAILEVVTNQYPDGVSLPDLSEGTGYQASSGGFNNALSKLRTLELIQRGQPVKASPDLFL